MLASSFVPREEMLPLPDTPRRGNVSSSVSLGILRSCCPLPGFCSPSPQEYHYTHWAPPQQGLGLLKRQALSSTVCKNLSLSAHLFLLCQQFQRSFLVQVMLSVYTHTLSLSFLSLSSSGLPLLHSTCDSTPSYISAFTTFHSVVSFLPQVVQFFFLSPQIDFLGLQNDLIFLQLCLRYEASIRSSCYSSILTPSQIGWLKKKKKKIVTILETKMSKFKVLTDSVLDKGPLPGLQMVTISLCVLIAFPWYMHMKREGSLASFFSYKGTNSIIYVPHLQPNLNPITS